MIKNNISLTALFILAIFSCNKKTEAVNQINTQLKYKWSLISEQTIFPDSPRLNSSYNGISSDFYDFASNDTLTINLAGTSDFPTAPFRTKVKYWLQDQSTFIIDFSGRHLTNKIQILTDNLLVFSNDIKYLSDDNGNVTVHNGIKIDSLKR